MKRVKFSFYHFTQSIFFALIGLTLTVSSCSQEVDHQYSISGTVLNVDTEKPIVLSKYDPVLQIKTSLDTTFMDKAGAYELQYETTLPDLLRVDFPGRQYAMLVVDKNEKEIKLDVQGESGGTISISGSPNSEKLLDYDAFRAESNKRLITPTYTAMNQAKESGDPVAEAESVAAYVKNSKLHRKELIDFTEKEIGSSLALYGSMLRWTGDDEIIRLEKLVDAFQKEHPGLDMGKVMAEKVARYKTVALGQKAPEIKSQDQNGKPITLYDNLGKFTLIDFWASWCGPCIRQLPDLRTAYSNFHDSGFQVFSVSVDNKEDKWKEAIVKHEMPWLHASDVKGWQSELAADYNVTFIPFNLLVDEAGTIMHKNIHGEELQVTLANLLKK